MPDKKLRKRLKSLFSEVPKVAKEGRKGRRPRAIPARLTADLAGAPLAAPSGWLWAADSTGTFTFCSPEVEAVIGFTPPEMRGKALADLVLPGGNLASRLREALGASRPVSGLHFQTRHKDGRIVSLALNGLPTLDESGRVTGFHGALHVSAPAAAEAAPAARVIAPAAPAAPRAVETRTGWESFVQRRAAEAWGYVDSPAGTTPLGAFTTPELGEALARGEVVFREQLPEGTEQPSPGRGMALPIQLQNQTLGALNFFDEGGERPWTEDELALAQAVADQLALALENARLFAETRDFLTKQTLLYEVTRAAASALNLTEALQSAADALGRVLPDSDIAIMLLDEATNTLRIRASVGFPPGLAETLAIPLGQGVTGRTAQTNKAALVSDVRLEPNYIAGVSGLLSEVAVPLALGERVIGVLNVESPSANAFDESDVQLLSTLAGTLSAIIVNNNLLEAISRERERLALLYEVVRQLIASLDLNAVVETALQFAPRLGAQHAYLLLLGESDAESSFRATVPGLDHFSEAEARAFAQTIAHQGLEQWVLANQRPALVADTRLDSRWYTEPGHAQEEPARSVIAVPLRTQRGLLSGVLAYTHPVPDALTEDQLPLVESIAGQVAVALENATLYAQMHTQERSATALARATQALSGTLREADVFNLLADQLVETYHADGVVIWSWTPETQQLTPRVVRRGFAAPETEVWPTVEAPIAASERPYLLEVIQNGWGRIQPLSRDNPLHESMAMPLFYGGAVEGVVEVVRTGQEAGLEQSDIDLLQAVLASSSQALQSARLYELQRQTAERLTEVDRLKSQFLANMSHELRTPLNSIIGFSRVILKGIDGPVTDLQQQDLNSIHNAGQHLLGLINDILDMSRIEAGKMELIFDEVDLHDIIKGVMSTTLALVKDKPIALHQEIDPDLPTVRADSMRVRQVLLNLLANAAKFTERGSITLRARSVTADSPQTGRPGPHVELSVIDTGPGIAPNDMAKLFEPFSQVDASPTRKAGGTGLGLNITRHLVELHNGRIWAESEQGKGSTFTFLLPQFRAEEPEPPSPEAPALHPEARVILAVDDDERVTTLYQRYLEPHGYTVVGVKNSFEAVRRATELQPVAILLDVLMPEPDGWQVLTDLKRAEATKDIPVVICSIVAEEERGFSLGAVDYLVKPILEADLVRALNGLREPAANGQAQAVLVIDDRPEDLQFLRRTLEDQNGFQVIEARGGQAGLEAARTHHPQAIILDLLMPEMDGFEVLAALRRDPATSDIPVLVVTGADLSPQDRERLNLQAGALLRKGGFREADLIADLQRALAGARA